MLLRSLFFDFSNYYMMPISNMSYMTCFHQLTDFIFCVKFYVVSSKNFFAIITIYFAKFHFSNIYLFVSLTLKQYNKETYSRFQNSRLRESPSLVNGVRFRSLSSRSSWVQIPPPALHIEWKYLIF